MAAPARNDAGRTVKTIRLVGETYRHTKKIPRCVELTVCCELADGFPGGAGYEATVRAMRTVTERAVRALAEEFLP